MFHAGSPAGRAVGDGVTFTVVAWALANAFMAIQVVWPVIGRRAAGILGASWFEVFLSFTNLTRSACRTSAGAAAGGVDIESSRSG